MVKISTDLKEYFKILVTLTLLVRNKLILSILTILSILFYPFKKPQLT